jgi:hypothetical protein
MSTRCQIGFYEKSTIDINRPDALIYKHSDGYPDGEAGMLITLVPMLKDFNKQRGLSDTEYAAAWILFGLIQNTVNHFQDKKIYKTPVEERYWRYLGFGVCSDGIFHGDIEFYYAVTPEKLYIYQVEFGYDADNPISKITDKNSSIIKVISLKTKASKTANEMVSP